MDFINHVIRQPVTVAVGVILTLLAGLIALSRLPIQLTPNVDDTIIQVSTFWEGASPEEIEQNIIDKQEERLQGVANLVSMTSVSQQNAGSITLEFTVGTPKADALNDVRAKIGEVSNYPENVDQPVVLASDPMDRDYIAWIIFGSTDENFDIRTLQDYAEDFIKPALERVPGMSEVGVLGGYQRELQIRFDPVIVAQHGITPSQFLNAIRSANRNTSAGELQEGKRNIRVRTIGQFESVQDVRATVIAQTSGGPVTIGDVAEVVETFKEAGGFVRSKGRKVIAINAQREIGSNVMKVMDGLKAELARLTTPGGSLEVMSDELGLEGELFLKQIFDQTIYIDDALALVRNNIWIGGGLAIFVLLIFLRSVRSVGIIALAIPISVIGAIVAMVALGRSVNVISLAGMAFSVGMVVDNAIVVLENIFRHLEMGKKPMKAAHDGAREVWGAVLASTLTTIAVFIPILLIQEEAGQLFRDIALAICAAVALSLVVSITVIPTAAARLLKARKTTDPGGAARKPRRSVAGLIGSLIYLLCGSVVARVLVVAALTGASIYGTYLLIPPTDYLPRGNRNLVFGLIILPPGYNLAHKNELADRIEEIIHPYWEAGDLIDDPEAFASASADLPQVPVFDFMSGGMGDPVVPPAMENYFLVAFGDVMFHGAVSVDPTRVVDLPPLMNHSTRGDVAPGVFAFADQAALFGRSSASVNIDILGDDLDQIIDATLMLFGPLMGTYGPGQVRPAPGNFNVPMIEMQIVPDHRRLAEVGLTATELGMAVRANADGAIIGEYKIGGETIDLKVIAKGAVGQTDLSGLNDLPIATPTGHTVPLSSLAKLGRIATPQEIHRKNRRRKVSLLLTPPPGSPVEQMITEVQAMVQQMRESGQLPPTIDVQFSGSAGKLAAVKQALLGDGSLAGTLASSLALALVGVYLLMCVLFQSFLQPLVIMFSVPLATLGGFAALFGMYHWSVSDRYLPIQQLDVLTMLGFIILIGVVVNNAILIVHQTLNFMHGRADDTTGHHVPLPPRQAIAEAVRTRVRPIFMGTLTSVGGMMPLVLMPGAGSELYRGLGSVVLGGLLVSTIFTLLLVPLLLSLVLDARALFGRSAAAVEPAPASVGTAHPAVRRSHHS